MLNALKPNLSLVFENINCTPYRNIKNKTDITDLNVKDPFEIHLQMLVKTMLLVLV